MNSPARLKSAGDAIDRRLRQQNALTWYTAWHPKHTEREAAIHPVPSAGARSAHEKRGALWVRRGVPTDQPW
jgi:hypothetical protein